MQYTVLVSLALCLVTIGVEAVIMDISAEIQGLTVLGEKCGLEGKDLLEFVCSERDRLRKDKDRIDRDERAYQLQLRRQECEKLELQAKLKSEKRESVSEAPHASTRLKARIPKLPAFEDKLDISTLICKDLSAMQYRKTGIQTNGLSILVHYLRVKLWKYTLGYHLMMFPITAH